MTDQPPFAPPPDAETTKHWIGETARLRVTIAEQVFLIDHPTEAERLLENPVVRSALAADNYLPYWADLWPAARMLAKVILQESWTPGTEALEIGCGLGLPGIVALSKGLHLTFSDYDPMALRFAANNAKLNGFSEFKTLRLDWRCPPDGLRLPILLASDLVYEVRNVEPLVDFVKKVLAPGGLCLMTDQDRLPSQAMRKAVEDSGLEFSTQIVRAEDPGKKRVKGTLYRIISPAQCRRGSP